ncbi:MAG: YegS/Rv2252/BmrU family lipid kinase [Elusimicrobia bacterium]|nr:YegS/Rv2252/BmrU family lipid kinase [Elusimicrobiota bacterium]
MKILFLINPAAGHGRARGRWEAVSPRILEAHPASEYWIASSPGQVRAMVQDGLRAGFDLLLAVGGDGTLGEAVDGFLSAPASERGQAGLGTWPAGSGCDTARHFGIKPTAEALLTLLDRPRLRLVDAGVCEFSDLEGQRRRRHFVNVAGWGLAGEVAVRVGAAGKPWGGTLSYFAASLGALLGSRPRPMDLVIDGIAQPRDLYHLAFLANTSAVGGGMKVAPGADPQDGLLDFVAVEGISRLELLRRFPSVYSGRHLGSAGVLYRRVRRLEASSPERVFLNLDGEAVGVLPARLEALPSCLPFLWP